MALCCLTHLCRLDDCDAQSTISIVFATHRQCGEQTANQLAVVKTNADLVSD